jgi:hypothetical protein
MKIDFSKLQTKQKERIEEYCNYQFVTMKANVERWFAKRNDKDRVRSITHGFYNTVHSLSVPSGLISVEAVNKKKQEPEWALCKDHCYSPQFIGRMIMDNSDKYLNDYNLYRKLFIMTCTTIIVTPEENRRLSLLTCNRNNDFKIYAHTDKKYEHLNIQLVEKAEGVKWYMKDMKPSSNYIETPNEILEYEKQFLVV